MAVLSLSSAMNYGAVSTRVTPLLDVSRCNNGQPCKNYTLSCFADVSRGSGNDVIDFRAFTWMDLLDYVLQLFLAGLIILMNGGVVYTIVSSPRLHKVSYFIIGSLAITDFVMGIARPLQALLDIGILRGRTVCLLSHCFVVTLALVSMQHLALVSLDRFIRIKYPFRYKDIMSRTRVSITISMFWLTSSLISFMPLMGIVRDDFDGIKCYPEYYMPVWYFFSLASGSFITISLLLCVVYLKIYLIFRRKRVLFAEKGFRHRHMSHRMRSIGAAKLLGVLCVYFFLSWCPYSVIRVVQVTSSGHFNIPVVAQRLAQTLAVGNSLGNPLLYAMRERSVRSAMKAILFKGYRVD